jgi:hypothetical protein
MSSSGNTFPVSNALTHVLRVFQSNAAESTHEEEANEYLVLSYRDGKDFDLLWNLHHGNSEQHLNVDSSEDSPDRGIVEWANSGVSGSHKTKNLVVVWDGIPEPLVVGNVYLGSYVTPYDWIVAFFLELQSRGISVNPRLRFHIVDLISNPLTASESARLYHHLHFGGTDLLKCVRLYGRMAAAMDGRKIDSLISDILLFANERITLQTDALTGLDASLMRRIWGARLLATPNPRDRHAIANLVGPQLLISAMTSRAGVATGKAAPCLRALLSLMRVLGLFPLNSEKVSGPWIAPNSWRGSRAVDTQPVIVLLDDMHDLGWADFVRLALGVEAADEKNGAFVASDAPDAKKFGPNGVASLLELITDPGGRLRVGGGLELCQGRRDAVLFLDLRLFNNRSVEEEMRFFEGLLTLARQVESGKTTQELPWTGFTGQEIQAIENCIAFRKVENDDYLVALTMLPRLLALVDPMLPIVLFSSTGQRRVAEALRDYRNIITHFDKPRFFAEAGGGIVEDTRDRFERAVSDALDLLRARRVCKGLEVGSVNAGNDLRQHYIEIYIDEADRVDDSTFRVGGLAIICDDKKQADQLNTGMVSGGLVWGSTEVDPAPLTCLPKQSMPWRDYQTKIFGPVEALLKSSNVREVMGFSLAVSPTFQWGDTTDLTSPSCLDNLYRSLVLLSLETLLFEALPQRLNQVEPNFTCSIYVATRNRFESDADTPSDWDPRSDTSIARRYGIKIRQSKQNQLFFTSVTSDTVYPMVAQVRALMPGTNIKVITARGSQLFYGVNNQYPESLPRPAHLLADLAVRFANNAGALSKQPTLRKWLKNGFVATADDQFVSTLEACRRARMGNHVEAILATYKASRLSANKGVAWWAKPRVSRSVSALSGLDFAELAHRLADPSA